MNEKNLVGIIFAIIGGIFLTIGIVSGVYIFGDGKTTGVITDINDNVTCYSYEVEGKRYNQCDGSYSSTYKVGKEINIYYDLNNPEESSTGTMKLFCYIFSIIGGIFLTIGIFMLIPNNKKKLIQTGIMISTTVTSIDLNVYVSINGVHPYVIKTKGFYENDEREFKSENFYNNVPNVNIGDSVTVYIDPKNSKRYYMDFNC